MTQRDIDPGSNDFDIPSDMFFVESHVADAMPFAHWHDHIEINYLPHGKMDYLLNGRRVTLHPRRLGVFWAANHHQAIDVGEKQNLFCAYVPVGEFLSLPVQPAFRAAVMRGELVQSATASRSDGVRLAEIINTWDKSDPALRQLYREELLLRLRRLSLEPVATPNAQEPDADQRSSGRANLRSIRHVERMTAFINENLVRSLTVGEVAAVPGLHPTTARAAFRRVLGISISKYVRRQRISQAMRLLAESDFEIAEIAHMVGYSSLPRLYDAFHENVGKTPRRFRQEIKAHPDKRLRQR